MTFAYTYDNYGNRITMTGPMGTTTYAYDNYNRLASITDPNGKITKYTTDQLGRRIKEELPNSITTTYSYDEISRLAGISTLNSQLSTLSSYAYGYDRVDNKTSITTQAGEHTYGYDNLYQLTSATHPDQPAENYTYDKIGNRNPLTFKHSAWNQILEDDKYTYTYDDNGNRTERKAKDGTLRDVYTWNAENRLIKFERYDNINATTPITTATYKYDALGRRIEKSVIASGSEAISTRYLYDGINIIAETDGGGTITTIYTQGQGIDEPISMTRNNTYYYHRDTLGSITSLTDETGNVVQEYRYDSFGNITYMKDSNFIQPFTFTGREYDPESGLYYYRERTLDPNSGTFISSDPIGFDTGDVNLYWYVRGNPLSLIDPSGLLLGGPNAKIEMPRPQGPVIKMPPPSPPPPTLGPPQSCTMGCHPSWPKGPKPCDPPLCDWGALTTCIILVYDKDQFQLCRDVCMSIPATPPNATRVVVTTLCYLCRTAQTYQVINCFAEHCSLGGK